MKTFNNEGERLTYLAQHISTNNENAKSFKLPNNTRPFLSVWSNTPQDRVTRSHNKKGRVPANDIVTKQLVAFKTEQNFQVSANEVIDSNYPSIANSTITTEDKYYRRTFKSKGQTISKTASGYFGDEKQGEQFYRPVTRDNTLSADTISMFEQDANGADLPYEMTIVPVKSVIDGVEVVKPRAYMRQHGLANAEWQPISIEYARDFPTLNYNDYTNLIAPNDRATDVVLSKDELAMTLGVPVGSDDGTVLNALTNNKPSASMISGGIYADGGVISNDFGREVGHSYQLVSPIGVFGSRDFSGSEILNGPDEVRLHSDGLGGVGDLNNAKEYVGQPMALRLNTYERGQNQWEVVVQNPNKPNTWVPVKAVKELNLPGLDWDTYAEMFSADKRIDQTIGEFLENSHTSKSNMKTIKRSLRIDGVNQPEMYMLPADLAVQANETVETYHNLGKTVEIGVSPYSHDRLVAFIDSKSIQQTLFKAKLKTRDSSAQNSHAKMMSYGFSLKAQGLSIGIPSQESETYLSLNKNESDLDKDIYGAATAPNPTSIAQIMMGGTHNGTVRGRSAGDMVVRNVSSTKYGQYNKIESHAKNDTRLMTMLTGTKGKTSDSREVINFSIHENSFKRSSSIELLSLDEMIVGLNETLTQLKLPVVEASVENNYAGLPLDLLHQKYSERLLVKALQTAGFTSQDILHNDSFIVSTNAEGQPMNLADMLNEKASEPVKTDLEYLNKLVDALTDGLPTGLETDDLDYLTEHQDAVLSTWVKLDGRRSDKSAAKHLKDLLQQVDVVKNTGEQGVEDDVDLDNVLQDEEELAYDFDRDADLKTRLAAKMVGSDAPMIEANQLTNAEQQFLIDAKVMVANAYLSENQKAKLENNELKVVTQFDTDHVMHYSITDLDGSPIVKDGKEIAGKVGQIFLPNEQNIIAVNYVGETVEHKVPGFTGRYVSNRKGWNTYKNGLVTQVKAETGLKGAAAEAEALKRAEWKTLQEFTQAGSANLPYRLRVKGFDQALHEAVAREITFQALDFTSDDYDEVTSLARLYKGDQYMTKIDTPALLNPQSKERELALKHLASKVRFDKTLLDEYNLYFNENEREERVRQTMRIVPDSMRGTIFDPVAGGTGGTIALAVYLTEDAYNKIDAREGVINNFSTKADIEANQELAYGFVLRESDMFKQHINDPLNRTVMAINQLVTSDTIVPNSNVAFMNYKGYTMDDGTVITDSYAKRVGQTRAREQGLATGLSGEDLENFINTVGTASTREHVTVLINGVEQTFEGMALSVGDKLSTTHGNKATISKIIDPTQKGNEFFAQNPELEMVMAPEALISRMNLGEATEQINADIKPEPLYYNGEIVGYRGQTTVLDTDIKASHKTKLYDEVGGRGGRRVGNQLVWSLLANNATSVYAEAFANQKSKLTELEMQLQGIGMHYDIKTATINYGNVYSDEELSNGVEGVPVLDLSTDEIRRQLPDHITLPVEGGYIKLPQPVDLLANEADKPVMSSYLYVLPEKLRSGMDLVGGETIAHEYTKLYEGIVDMAIAGKFDLNPEDEKDKSTTLLHKRVASLTTALIQDNFGGKSGDK